MKRNIMTVAFVAAIALFAGINVFNVQKTVTLSDIAMENVDALASNEGGYGDKYCTLHIKCFGSDGSETGKYMADSYKGPTCNYDTPHDHPCTNCKSR